MGLAAVTRVAGESGPDRVLDYLLDFEPDSKNDHAGSGVSNGYARGGIRTRNANGASLLLDPDVKGEIRHIKVARNCLADHGFSLIELPHM